MINRSVTLTCALLLLLLSLPRISPAAETIVPEGTRIYLQLNDHIGTSSSNEGDSFKAIVTDPVYIGERMVIPKGSVVSGSISRILRPGRFKGKAAMTLLFQSIHIPGRGELPIIASLTGVDRQGNRGINSEGTIQGEGSEGRDVAKVLTPGLAGAGIGTLAGGRKGAGIGAGVGAAIGLATVLNSRGKDIDMQRGSALEITLDKALSLPPEAEGTAAKTR